MRLSLLCAVELGLFLVMGMARSDMPMAMHLPSFWWKLASLGLIGLVSGTVAIMSLDPARSPRRGLRWIVALIAACLASGWLLDASRDGLSILISRLDWRDGLQCLYTMVGSFNTGSHRPWLADAARRADGSRRNGVGRGFGGSSMGGVRLRVRLPLRRSSLCRGLVLARLRRRHAIRSIDAAAPDPLVTRGLPESGAGFSAAFDMRLARPRSPMPIGLLRRSRHRITKT